MKKYSVSIIDMENRDIFDGVQEAVNLLGGMKRFVKPGNLVFIKPNMFLPEKDYNAGKTTDPRVIIAAARLAKEAGGRVIVGERTKNPILIFKEYREIYDYAEVISLDDAPHRHRRLFGARHLKTQIPIPDIIDDCDVFINIPGLRTHMLTLISNALKNLMGLIPEDNTRYIHMFGLEGGIVDLNYHRPSDLVISDAVFSLQGNFPGEGWPEITNVLMAADNAVASDVVAAKVIGHDPTSLNFLVEANKRGLGPLDLEEINIVGEALDFASRRINLEQTRISYEPFKEKVTIIDRGACPACKRGLIGGLTDLRLTAPNLYKKLKADEVTVLVGPMSELPENLRGDILCYGNCTYKYRCLGEFEFGCPPLVGQARVGLSNLLQRDRVKLGYCSIGMRNRKIEEIIPKIADIGYQGIELWVPHLNDYLERYGELESLKELILKTGLTVIMIVPYFNLTGGEEKREESFVQAEKAVKYARLFNTDKVRVFVGGPASGDSTQKDWDLAVDGIKHLCNMDEKIRFLVETHDNQLQDTVDTTVKLLRKVDRDNFGVNLDIFNLYMMGEDPVSALERLFPAVWNVHLKNWRLIPGGREIKFLKDGDMDYGPFLTRLKEKGYNGFVSVEWFGDNPESAAKHEYAYLTEVLLEEHRNYK